MTESVDLLTSRGRKIDDDHSRAQTESIIDFPYRDEHIYTQIHPLEDDQQRREGADNRRNACGKDHKRAKIKQPTNMTAKK